MMGRRILHKGAAVFLLSLLCMGCKRTGNEIPAVVNLSEHTQQESTEVLILEGLAPPEEVSSTQEVMTTKGEASAQENTTEETTAEAETVTTQEVETETDAATAEETTTEAEAVTTQEIETETEAEAVTTQEAATVEETTTEEVTTTEAPTLSEEERHALMRQLIAQELPGIVCWGDSLTAGYGGNGESYPAALSRLISERLIEGIPVVNNGVCVEPTYTIMARAGAFPIYADAFDIPADCVSVSMHINLAGGMYTNLTSFGDAGLNPVTIAGVRGTLLPDTAAEGYGYLRFCRLEPGEAVHVEGMTPVFPASTELYGGYINVLFMGENGFYESPEDLISQYQRIIDARSLDRYIIIGLTTGDNSQRGELSSKMAAAFGDNYIDMRIELCNRGPELVGLERREDEWYNIQEGIVMPYLMSDNIHLNEYGYRAVGAIVYERMEQIGYFDKVKDIIEAYN